MTQRTKLLKLVNRNPGLTATGYTRLLGFGPQQLYFDGLPCGKTYYKPATILRELHRFVERGLLVREQGEGMIHGKAWRFYPNYR